MKRSLTLTALFSLVTLGLVPCAMGEVDSYYFKEKRVLIEKPGEMAIMRISGDQGTGTHTTSSIIDAAQSAKRGLTSRGVHTAEIRPLGLDGWWRADLALVNVGRSAAQVRDAVTSASKDVDTAFVSPVFAGENGGELIATPTILVQFSESVSPSQAESILRDAGAGTIVERNTAGLPNAFKLHCPAKDAYQLLEIVNGLAVRSDVIFAESDMISTGQSSYVPDDPYFPYCWWLDNTGQSGGTIGEDIDGPEAWDIATASSSVSVLVIDTGVEAEHPDINQLAGNDFTTIPGSPLGAPGSNCDIHGTAVAGCISGKINNSIGGAGIAPDCYIVSARCYITTEACDGSWNTVYSWTADALEWARLQGIRITNNSNYFSGTSAVVSAKYQQTFEGGMIHFASAGNDGGRQIWYPANAPGVISVGATDKHGLRASFSNYGPGLDITAPGHDILTTDISGYYGYAWEDYAYVNGTSFASPIAAGVAALMLSVNSSLTPEQMESLIYSTATDKGTAGWDETYGNGIVNARRAVEAALSSGVHHWSLY